MAELANLVFKKHQIGQFHHLELLGLSILRRPPGSHGKQETNTSSCLLCGHLTEVYFPALWQGFHRVKIRLFKCLDPRQLYQLQAAANRMFRLRHPFLADFLGVCAIKDCDIEDDSVPLADTEPFDFENASVALVFEDLNPLSLLDWIYTPEGLKL